MNRITAAIRLASLAALAAQTAVVTSKSALDSANQNLTDFTTKTGLLFPGGYAQVHLQVKVAASRVQVPVNALLFRSEGLRAVVVDANHKSHLRELTIGRDFGTTLDVVHGLKPDDWIVVNPPDSINEGEDVRVKQVAQTPGLAQPDATGTPAPAPQPKAPATNGAPGAKR